MNKQLIVITGPTAVGKTELSLKLAKHFSTEIVSADSRQFYKEMNIGTAKPTTSQLNEVRHHFINSLSIKEDYNAGRFETDCVSLLDKLFQKHERIILTGGSGLYINAILYGVDNLPKADCEIRASIKEQFEKNGIESLQQQLKLLDSEYYNTADIRNPHRLMRAIEVCLLTGKKYSSLVGKKNEKRNFDFVLFGLQIDKKELHERINTRVDKMISEGLVDEVKTLLPFKHCNALQTVGYKELFQYFEEAISLDEAISLIKKHTRNYAKRQMTWFRKMKEIKWLDASDPLLFEKCISMV
ncbi:MAG: tRNA (adenosine(37)-N6)-dimethylallyltransferase MiaA [Bacteroidia bacterium]